MNIRGYFDLSQPATFGARRPASTASGAQTPAPTSTPSRQLTLAWQIAIYFILLGAIVASRFLDLYRAGVPSAFQLDWAYLSFIAICSLLAFPVVYDKALLSKDQPFFLQIGLIFTAGMGWEKIVSTAVGK